MHATRVLEIWLRRNCPFMHRARLAAVVKIVDGVVFGGKATLADLGRGIRNRVLEKHNVKCADRLIGNAHLGAERLSIYQALAHWLLGSVERPWIIVDWSDVELGREHLMLKAAVPVGGSAVLIYEELTGRDNCRGETIENVNDVTGSEKIICLRNRGIR